VGLGVKILLGIAATFVLFRIFGLYSGYSYFLDVLVSGSGMDVMRAKPIAFVLSIISFALVPSALAFLFLGRGGWKFQSLAAVAGGMVFLWTYYIAEDVYFDRKTGESLRCYARTPAGIRYSSTCDYDPEFGIKYQKITPEVMFELKKSESGGAETLPVTSAHPIRKTLDVLAEDPLFASQDKANLELWKWVKAQKPRENVESVSAFLRTSWSPREDYVMYVEGVFVVRPYVIVSIAFYPLYNEDLSVKIDAYAAPEVRDKFAHTHVPVQMMLERTGFVDFWPPYVGSYRFHLNSREVKRMLLLVRSDTVEDFESGSVVVSRASSTFKRIR
jgi:hypothetical protein